jgi:hypothetical protein
VKITAAMIWYDERPEDLEACVRGMANIADRVVAVDGAYRRYPNARVTSPPQQAEMIRSTAAELGLECEIHEPTELWAGQVEKRSFTLQRASQDSDWVAVVDSDWIIRTQREAARAEIAEMGSRVDVIAVRMLTPPSDMPFATGWHQRQSGTRRRIPHLFRSLPGMRVEKRHWWYSAVKDGQRVWMWNDPMRIDRPVLRAYRMVRTRYDIEHRTLLRDEKHILDSRAFLNDREMVVHRTGQEDDLPHLPRPKFDYETVRPF